jgi:hypothetical protein
MLCATAFLFYFYPIGWKLADNTRRRKLMKHEFDLEQIDYDNSNYELDIWSSCFNPIFSPPPEVIKEWNLQFDDDWDEPEPTLENTSVYFTEDGANYLIVGKTIIPVSEHFADSGKTVNEVIEDVIRYAVKSQKK